ncbi:MAG TPA: glucose-6-phosphate dehydrogenase [Candidatus Binataceae bacterium]|nr:glucose-6-phosphate dehydrogenase [Candidatus Binataceae bacterium]
MAQIVRLAGAAAVPPCSIVIFGASGDLAMRKLMPALYDLDACQQGMLAETTRIVGAARRPLSQEQFRAHAAEGIKRFSRSGFNDECWRRFAARLHYVPGAEGATGFAHLRDALQQIEAAANLPPNRIFYLAIPPGSIQKWVEWLHQVGLINPPEVAGFTRVVVEKPIGNDLASALAINQGLHRYLAESQIFRIDHYLGKETVRNFMVLRFANSIFEQVWNNHHVDNVQITVAEHEGVGTRADYYDHAGALRDMVQNHLLQLLALIAMEPPVTLEADAIQEAKLNVLRALGPLTPAEVANQVVRGRYTSGQIEGQTVPGYLEEAGVSAGSQSETFVALKLSINNWRWSGVPFYLRTGKRLAKRTSSIAIHFRPLPRILFAEHADLPANILMLRIQPDEGFSLTVSAKHPGLGLTIQPVRMDLHYAGVFGATSPEAYEMLLYEVMLGDQTLFVRADMVERSWGFVQSILDAWRGENPPRLAVYPAGSWGPPAADELLARGGHLWCEP